MRMGRGAKQSRYRTAKNKRTNDSSLARTFLLYCVQREEGKPSRIGGNLLVKENCAPLCVGQPRFEETPANALSNLSGRARKGN